jgi:hypothetical protein
MVVILNCFLQCTNNDVGDVGDVGDAAKNRVLFLT